MTARLDWFFQGKGREKTDKEKKRRVRNRLDYLQLCADILCKSAYKMCREVWQERSEKFDTKELKDACAAVKEAAAVVGAIEKSDTPQSEEIRIIFEDEEYAQ